MNNKQNDNQRKKVQKGLKSLRGQGEYYDIPKDIRASYALTRVGRDGINDLSKRLDISASELIERLGRSTLVVPDFSQVLTLDQILVHAEISSDYSLILYKNLSLSTLQICSNDGGYEL